MSTKTRLMSHSEPSSSGLWNWTVPLVDVGHWKPLDLGEGIPTVSHVALDLSPAPGDPQRIRRGPASNLWPGNSQPECRASPSQRDPDRLFKSTQKKPRSIHCM